MGALPLQSARRLGGGDGTDAGSAEGGEIAPGQPADLMLLDLTMPGVSGLSGLIALRAEFQSLPVMIVSAHDDPATIQRLPGRQVRSV